MEPEISPTGNLRLSEFDLIEQIGDVLPPFYLKAKCRSCGHAGDIDVPRLMNRYGPGLSLVELWSRLSCERCKAKASIHSILRRLSFREGGVPKVTFANIMYMMGPVDDGKGTGPDLVGIYDPARARHGSGR